MRLSELSKTQFRFIVHLANRFPVGTAVPSDFTRTELRKYAAYGGWSWAPAWIVKDQSRRTTRGTYSLPELTEYMNLPQSERDRVSQYENPDPRVLALAAKIASDDSTEDEPEAATV